VTVMLSYIFHALEKLVNKKAKIFSKRDLVMASPPFKK